MASQLQRIKQLKGVVTALITPMVNSDCEKTKSTDDICSVDFDSLRHIIQWQLLQGIQGFVVAGTTGENSALTCDEWERLVRFAVKEVSGKVPVLVGTGSNCTRTTIDRTLLACELGADGALVVTPYYVKPTQEGLYCHFKAVADRVAEFPILLYNVPSRTACDMLPETVRRLTDACDNIFGIKECGGNLRCQSLRKLCPSLLIFSGADEEAGEAISTYGVNGVISVTSGVAPSTVCNMYKLAASHDERWRALAESLEKLNCALFAEPNPTPVKWLLHYLGYAPSGIRGPLLVPSDELKQRLSNLACQLPFLVRSTVALDT